MTVLDTTGEVIDVREAGEVGAADPLLAPAPLPKPAGLPNPGRRQVLAEHALHATPTPGVATDPARNGVTDVDDLVFAVLEQAGSAVVAEAAAHLLDFLAGLDGDSWPKRWRAMERLTHGQARWTDLIVAEVQGTPDWPRYLTVALGQLILLDAVRISYEWIPRRQLGFWDEICAARDAEDRLLDEIDAIGVTPNVRRGIVRSIAHLCAHTGKTPRQLRARTCRNCTQ